MYDDDDNASIWIQAAFTFKNGKWRMVNILNVCKSLAI